MKNWITPIVKLWEMWASAAVAERYDEEPKGRFSATGTDIAVSRWTLHRAVFEKLTQKR